MEKYPLQGCFIHIADLHDIANSGIPDYAVNLRNALRKKSVPSFFYSCCEPSDICLPAQFLQPYDRNAAPSAMMRSLPQEEFIGYLNKHVPQISGKICFHMGVEIGWRFAPQTIAKTNAIIISHEFKALEDASRPLAFRCEKISQRLRQLNAASRVLFTEQSEKDAAVNHMRYQFGEKSANDLEEKSAVYPVPSNISPPAKLTDIKMRKNTVVTFATIQKRSQLEIIPTLARFLRQSMPLDSMPEFIVMGGLSEGNIGGLEIARYLAGEVFGLAEKTRGLLTMVHLLQLAEMSAALPYKNMCHKQAVTSVEDLKYKALPLQLYFNLEKSRISEVLNAHKYALIPFERGATGHSSTLSAVIDHGMIAFAQDNPNALELLRGGAMYLIEKPKIGNPNKSALIESFAKAIISHSVYARKHSAYEKDMIERGKNFRRARSWSNLATTIEKLAA